MKKYLLMMSALALFGACQATEQMTEAPNNDQITADQNITPDQPNVDQNMDQPNAEQNNPSTEVQKPLYPQMEKLVAEVFDGTAYKGETYNYSFTKSGDEVSFTYIDDSGYSELRTATLKNLYKSANSFDYNFTDSVGFNWSLSITKGRTGVEKGENLTLVRTSAHTSQLFFPIRQ